MSPSWIAPNADDPIRIPSGEVEFSDVGWTGRYNSKGMFRLVLILISSALASPAWAEWHTDTQPIMGTRVHTEVWHEDTNAGKAAVAAVMLEMRRINQLMSPYIECSELSRLNRGAVSGPVVVSKEMLDLLAKSIEVSKMSDGAFDVTYASAGRYYDYREGVTPDDETLKSTIEAINYRYIKIDWGDGTVRYDHPGVYVDLGGIAKGHAVDQAIRILEERGITDALVAAGGDSRIIGNRRGKPWTVGVKDPRKEGAMAVLLPLTDTAVSTSGDYERYFERDGVRFHHILDPSTGESARAVQSVTILGPETTFTDALSTSVFVLGPEAGMKLVDRLDGIDAIIIDGQGKLLYSAELEPAG